MLVLTIRTDNPEAELGLYNNSLKKDYLTWYAHQHLSETIHLRIKDLLKDNKTSMEQLGAIIVYQGPGSFTGLRIGITVANAMSYGLKIPLASSKSDDWIQRGLQIIDKSYPRDMVTPYYGNPVHITQAKK